MYICTFNIFICIYRQIYIGRGPARGVRGTSVQRYSLGSWFSLLSVLRTSPPPPPTARRQRPPWTSPPAPKDIYIYILHVTCYILHITYYIIFIHICTCIYILYHIICMYIYISYYIICIYVTTSPQGGIESQFWACKRWLEKPLLRHIQRFLSFRV